MNLRSHSIKRMVTIVPLIGVLVLSDSRDLLSDQRGVMRPVALGKGCTNAYAIDEDCDGFGTGPGVRGPDADDTDPKVNTFASVLAAYGTLAQFLRAQGYDPCRIFYIATNGDDRTARVGDASRPFRSWRAARGRCPNGLLPGDIILYRGGVYREAISTKPANARDAGARGAPGRPVVIMGCPGERVVIDVPGDAIEITGTGKAGPNHLVVRGMMLDNTTSPGRGRGINMFGDYYGPIRNVTIDAVESAHHFWGMMASQGLRDVTISRSVFHDNGGEHGAYLCARSLPNTKVTIRGCLFYRNAMQGIYHNGRITNLRIERTIVHSNGTAGLQLVNGVSHAVVCNNLIFNNGKQGIVMYNYCSDLRETCDYILPYDQTDNLFVNNTVWTGRNTIQGNAVLINDACAGWRACGREWSRSFDRNVFRNNVFVTHEHETFLFYQPRFTPTTVIEHNVVHKTKPGSPAVLRSGQERGTSMAFAEFERFSTLFRGNRFGDPRFMDIAFRPGADAARFDFMLDERSPGIDAGIPKEAPTEDLRGNPRDALPDAGCYERPKRTGER